MVKYNNEWGTVCDDGFETVDAQSACHTLGFSGGSFTHGEYVDGEIWMDEVNCASSTTNFLTCSHNGWGVENCSHSEDIILTCT